MLIRCTKKAMDYEFLVLLLAHCFFNLKSLCVGVSSIKGFQLSITPLGLLHQVGGFDDIRSMLASMTISSTISPFVIDDNNSCSPYEHAPPFFYISPFVFISPPLASMEKGVHILVSEISDHCWLLPLSICTVLGPVCMPGVTILSPLSSFSSLMNSRCAKIFERPYTWLAVWQPSSLLWSASPFCNCSVFLIHTCFLASVLWASVPSLSLLVFLAELYVSLLISFQQFCALCPNLLHDQHLTELLELPILLWSTSFLHAWAYPWL